MTPDDYVRHEWAAAHTRLGETPNPFIFWTYKIKKGFGCARVRRVYSAGENPVRALVGSQGTEQSSWAVVGDGGDQAWNRGMQAVTQVHRLSLENWRESRMP